MAKTITDEKKTKILAEAKNKLGPVSDRVKNATSFEELPPALRELMHPDTASPRRVVRVALSFSRKHKLAGI